MHTRADALVIITCILIACSVVVGCSDNPYPAGETSQPILYLSLADDPKTLDPSVAYDVGAATVMDPIYPAYLKYHYLKRDPFVLEPCLGTAEPVHVPYTYTACGEWEADLTLNG